MKELGKNALEWAVFSLSCLLVAGVIGILAWSTWRGGDAPAQLLPRIGEVRAVGGSWQIEIEVENRGDAGAENVEVEVEWPATKQNARFVLIEVPPRGARKGTAVFRAVKDSSPGAHAFKAQIVGWSQ